MTKEDLKMNYEIIERFRREVYDMADRASDELLRRLCGFDFDHTISLREDSAKYSWLEPSRVTFEDGRTKEVCSWKDVAAVVLADCARKSAHHERLTEMAGLTLG